MNENDQLIREALSQLKEAFSDTQLPEKIQQKMNIDRSPIQFLDGLILFLALSAYLIIALITNSIMF